MRANLQRENRSKRKKWKTEKLSSRTKNPIPSLPSRSVPRHFLHGTPHYLTLPLSAFPPTLPPETRSEQAFAHASRQYLRSRYPSLNCTSSFRTDKGPNPGAPSPPRMHAGMHFRVHRTTASPLEPEVSLERGEGEVDVDVEASASASFPRSSGAAERDVGKSVALDRARIVVNRDGEAVDACSCGGKGAGRECGGAKKSIVRSLPRSKMCFVSFIFFEQRRRERELPSSSLSRFLRLVGVVFSFENA